VGLADGQLLLGEDGDELVELCAAPCEDRDRSSCLKLRRQPSERRRVDWATSTKAQEKSTGEAAVTVWCTTRSLSEAQQIDGVPPTRSMPLKLPAE